MARRNKLYNVNEVWKADDGSLIDSVKANRYDFKTDNMRILFEAQRCWDNMDIFRRNRERAKRYHYGEQWDDRIEVNGKSMTEEEYIQSQGGIPLKNNLIRRLVKNVVGVYRSQSKEPTCVARDRNEQILGEVMSTVLQANWQLNKMSEVNARSLEEFLISGLIVHKKTYGWENNKLDCWTKIVPNENWFVDGGMKDLRGWDCSITGELHDLPFKEVCSRFAKCPEDVQKLRHIYSRATTNDYLNYYADQFGFHKLKNVDFFTPAYDGLCRIIEVWRKEVKERYHVIDPQNGEFYKIDVEDYKALVTDVNEQRRKMGAECGMSEEEIPYLKAEWFVDSYWYYRFMTPTGEILDEGETPYDHQAHPYVFRAYPFIDGEIHSFVSDVIDQQRIVNRLFILYDTLIRSSAKGSLMIAEESIPDTMDISDIAENWAKVGGIVVYKAKNGAPIPQQISANSTNVGIESMMQMELRFFEDISGVNGALQGKPGYSGTSGSLYAQQAQNATTSLLDILDTFSSFEVDCAYKDVRNMQQYYDDKREVNIAGQSSSSIYDPIKVRDVDFDLNIVEATTTPAYRMMADDFIKQIWASGQITLEQMLENINEPYADKLLQSVRVRNEEMQKQAEEQQQAMMAQGGEAQGEMPLVNQPKQ